jgi:hypothetical protein
MDAAGLYSGQLLPQPLATKTRAATNAALILTNVSGSKTRLPAAIPGRLLEYQARTVLSPPLAPLRLTASGQLPLEVGVILDYPQQDIV